MVVHSPVYRTCPSGEILDDVIWDDKKPDTRLDDGTTDIDILDAAEYSIEEYSTMLLDAEFLR